MQRGKPPPFAHGRMNVVDQGNESLRLVIDAIRADERAKVVAWLRARPGPCSYAARVIEEECPATVHAEATHEADERAKLARVLEAADALAEAVKPFAKANVVEPNGAIVGLERWHFERAAEALAAYRKARHG